MKSGGYNSGGGGPPSVGMRTMHKIKPEAGVGKLSENQRVSVVASNYNKVTTVLTKKVKGQKPYATHRDKFVIKEHRIKLPPSLLKACRRAGYSVIGGKVVCHQIGNGRVAPSRQIAVYSTPGAQSVFSAVAGRIARGFWRLMHRDVKILGSEVKRICNTITTMQWFTHAAMLKKFGVSTKDKAFRSYIIYELKKRGYRLMTVGEKVKVVTKTLDPKYADRFMKSRHGRSFLYTPVWVKARAKPRY